MILETLTQWFGVIVAGTGALVAVFKYILLPSWRNTRKVVRIAGEIERVLPTILHINEQFKPNGGNSLRDVIDRIDLEIAINKSRVHVVLGHLNTGTFEINKSGKCVWVSRRWCLLSGMLPHEADGNGWMSAIHPDDRKQVVTEWNESVGAFREFDMIFRFRTREGEITWVHCHTTVLEDSTGNPVGFLGSVVPVNVPSDDREQPAV